MAHRTGNTAVLLATLVVAVATIAARPAQQPALQPAQQPAQQSTLLPEQQAQHALSRLAFGPRPGDIAKVRAMGVDKWIDQQLHPEKIDDRAISDALARYSALDAKTSDIATAYREAQRARREAQRGMPADSMNPNQQPPPQFDAAAARGLQNRVISDLNNSKLARAATSERQLYEVMVDFWENHFSVFVGKNLVRVYLLEYDRDVIRPRAMGKFRDLLGAVAKSPAMLFYLDNAQSQGDSAHPRLQQPRQFAQRNGLGGRRPGQQGQQGQQQAQEIERYCNAQRSEANLPQRLAQAPPEVVENILKGSPAECARALTQLAERAQQQPARGLNENYARELMELHTLGVDGGYSQTDVIAVARALTGWTIDQQRAGFMFNPVWHDAATKTVLGVTMPAGRGMEDGEQVLDIVARHPSTARFITTKLARRFVADEPPQSVVDRCSAVFTKTDGDIRQVVGCVVKSTEFMSPAAYRAKVKTPFEVVVSGMRATNAQLALGPGAPQVMAFLGQPMFGRPTPDGWPDVAREWMNAGAILNRINFGLALAGGRAPGLMRGVVPELEAVRSAPRDKQVDAVVRVLLGGQVSPETREILMSGENPLASRYSDTTEGTNMDARPERVRLNPARGNAGLNMGRVSLSGLDQIIGLALGAPEFQRR
jgi:uncharacterized protein (DUF1800 family)